MRLQGNLITGREARQQGLQLAALHPRQAGIVGRPRGCKGGRTAQAIGKMGDSQTASTPKRAKCGRRAVMPGKSPIPSPEAS